MKLRGKHEIPPEVEKLNRRAVRIEWWTIGWMLSIITLIYLTLGNSQAMKAAWIEDLLSLVPPIAFLVASRFRHREPDERFPYGYQRSINIAFLCAAVALLTMGAYAIIDSAMALAKREHPTIGMIELFGYPIWLGWVMIIVLAYSGIPPVILGRKKLPLSEKLHDKALHADADMNKADWLTALAGIIGVLGIGAGFWWADSVAALFISVEITRDGVKNIRRVTGDLMDRRPMTTKGKIDDTAERIADRIRALSWVGDADARLREEGHLFTGEVYVVPRHGTGILAQQMEEVRSLAEDLDWRVYDIVVMPVPKL